tara:strand:- start:2440 stop:2598 length:159 start_codon:yes stop_codon:yes gene_type:complete
MELENEEINILVGLLSRQVKLELEKDNPNYNLIAYYNNIQLKLGLMKKFKYA